MQVDVYEREGDAVEAAAEVVAARIRDAGEDAMVAVCGSRRARALLAALAAHSTLPWMSIRWVVIDGRGGDGAGPDSPWDVVYRTALEPNGVAPVARGWGEELTASGGDRPQPDVVALVAEADGGVAGLTPADAATLAAADAVVVLATGSDVAAGVHAALTAPPDLGGRPLQRLLPGERCTWVLDRAAAAPLIASARPVAT